MRVFILTVGSRGDVQPYVALGKGLKKAGHAVTVCTSSSFASFITAHGLNYGYMNNEFLEVMGSAAGREAMERGSGFSGLLKTTISLLKRAKALTRRMLRDSWEAAQAAGADMIIYHPKGLGGAHIAEKLGIPAVLAVPIPMLVPTTEFVAVGFPELKLGGWYNKLSYAAVHKGYRLYNDVVNEFRRETLGLKELPGSTSPVRTAGGSPIPVLHAYSPLVWPRPCDWPETAYVTGYWLLEQEDDLRARTPPAGLTAFLEAGEKPVYVGFGSMAGRNPERMAGIVLDALQKAGVRGIVATGWGGLAHVTAGSLPDTIFQIDSVPHDWLFPQVAAVVHHGGAGTTAAGLRAGRPTVICPFIVDQPYWGKRVYALGAGTKPIPQKKLTAQKLAEAIREVTTNRAIRKKAEVLGEQLRREDGIAKAVTLIESIARAGTGK